MSHWQDEKPEPLDEALRGLLRAHGISMAVVLYRRGRSANTVAFGDSEPDGATADTIRNLFMQTMDCNREAILAAGGEQP